MKTGLKKVLLFLLLNFAVYTFAFSQQVQQTPYTLEQIELEISQQQQKLQSLQSRAGNLQNGNDQQSQQIQQSITDVQAEIQRLNDIKLSIQSAQNNMGNGPITPQSKDQFYSNNQLQPEKIKFKRVDFEALPQHKKETILANPDKYEIID